MAYAVESSLACLVSGEHSLLTNIPSQRTRKLRNHDSVANRNMHVAHPLIDLVSNTKMWTESIKAHYA